jgi:putative acyl-CoA dehydrogenase
MLRILTPLLKLFTAKQSIAVVSESLESLGGTGYMEVSF